MEWHPNLKWVCSYIQFKGEGKLIWGRGGEGGLMEKDVEDTKKKTKEKGKLYFKNVCFDSRSKYKRKKKQKKDLAVRPKTA